MVKKQLIVIKKYYIKQTQGNLHSYISGFWTCVFFRETANNKDGTFLLPPILLPQ